MDTSIFIENGSGYTELQSKRTDYGHNQFEEVLEADTILKETVSIDSKSSHEDEAEEEERNSLCKLIQSWGFGMETYKLLRTKNVTLETLEVMKERHIDELFSSTDFHTKVIFEHKLTIWQNKLKDLNVSIATSADSAIDIWIENNRNLLKRRNVTYNKFECSTPSTSHSLIDDVTIAEILNGTEQGKLLLESCKEQNLLKPADRTSLVHRIIQYYIENNIKLTVKKIQYFSEQIIDLFSSESQNTYFIGRGKLPPKGKLWDRYQTQLRNIKKLSTFKAK